MNNKFDEQNDTVNFLFAYFIKRYILKLTQKEMLE